jgi:hypothetical protein
MSARAPGVRSGCDQCSSSFHCSSKRGRLADYAEPTLEAITMAADVSPPLKSAAGGSCMDCKNVTGWSHGKCYKNIAYLKEFKLSGKDAKMLPVISSRALPA